MPRDRKFQISHYWADLEQCFNLHMPPDFYLSTNLTQRPSATDNENVFKEIRGYPFVSLRQAAGFTAIRP